MPDKPLTVALVGNPNAGKSTLFNALSGLRQHVGNYPGVTVEMKKGQFTVGEVAIELIDLPGTYSLAARSPDEMVAVDLLLGRRPEEPPPDVVLSIVDASNLDRHLYLTTQLLELGVPVVLAVNMVDVATAQGLKIDFTALAANTGMTVIPVQANKGVGLEALKSAIVDAAKRHQPPPPVELPAAIHREAEKLSQEANGELPPFLARRLLFDVGGYVEQWQIEHHGAELRTKLDAARERLKAEGCSIPAAEAKARFAWVRNVVAKSVTKPAVRPVTWTDRIDKVLTHRVWGSVVFLAVMFLVFQSIFVFAEPLMEMIEGATGWLADFVKGSMDAGPLRALLADGIVQGVGGVVVFLPQILILFAFIAVLEDCGYMARAAFLMDRVMSRWCGLSGKSFIPLLSSMACAIPGVMATRVIENRRDRLATILVAPLMSCSARLPVYALLIGAFLSIEAGFAWWVRGLTLFSMYMIGFLTAAVVARLLRKTLLRGETPLFVMELPAYKRPSIFAVLRRMFDAGWAFVRRASTIILASMIVVWALLYFPDRNENGERYENLIAYQEERPESEKESADEETNRLNAEWKARSLMGQAGKALEPAFRPLGWDWKLGTAALASFPAREVIVGTLGIIYEQGDDPDNETLGASIRADWEQDETRKKYGVAVALSVMVFFALCCQCASTLAVIRRETQSWAWTVFTFVYMTVLAYLGALVTFQLGRIIIDIVGG